MMRTFLILLILLISPFTFSQTSVNSCINRVSGKVVNKQNDEIIPNAIISIDDKNGNIKTTHADAQGNFSVELPCDDSRYLISTIVENFTKSTKLVFTSKTVDKTHTISLDLYPIKEFVEVNGRKRIVVESIVFDPDDISINSDSKKTLKRVCDILNKYQDINIEIAFHTDSRGEPQFMLNLTQQRADACASFLIEQGIDASRIVAKGYGSTKLLNECEKGVKCSEEKHLMNRRSEFVVIK